MDHDFPKCVKLDAEDRLFLLRSLTPIAGSEFDALSYDKSALYDSQLGDYDVKHWFKIRCQLRARLQKVCCEPCEPYDEFLVLTLSEMYVLQRAYWSGAAPMHISEITRNPMLRRLHQALS